MEGGREIEKSKQSAAICLDISRLSACQIVRKKQFQEGGDDYVCRYSGVYPVMKNTLRTVVYITELIHCVSMCLHCQKKNCKIVPTSYFCYRVHTSTLMFKYMIL